jgi:D-glycero-D-manno-heptose 1,7-bisphosphate phosphatase
VKACERRCVFFDRDGIVNRSPGDGYVLRVEDFHVEPDFVRALRVVRDRGYVAVVVTNQRCIALGIVRRETVDDMHRRLREQLRADGLDLLDVRVCPHDRGPCECRKPKPGMLLDAARLHGLDLKASWMVGDRERDIEAGRAAGCRTILVSPTGEPTQADRRVADLAELPALLQSVLRGAGEVRT